VVLKPEMIKASQELLTEVEEMIGLKEIKPLDVLLLKKSQAKKMFKSKLEKPLKNFKENLTKEKALNIVERKEIITENNLKRV